MLAKGSYIAGPDGEWIIAAAVGTECLLVAALERNAARRERQNLDQAGHRSRPGGTRLVVDRRRQSVASFED
jgi:nitrilase